MNMQQLALPRQGILLKYHHFGGADQDGISFRFHNSKVFLLLQLCNVGMRNFNSWTQQLLVPLFRLSNDWRPVLFGGLFLVTIIAVASFRDIHNIHQQARLFRRCLRCWRAAVLEYSKGHLCSIVINSDKLYARSCVCCVPNESNLSGMRGVERLRKMKFAEYSKCNVLIGHLSLSRACIKVKVNWIFIFPGLDESRVVAGQLRKYQLPNYAHILFFKSISPLLVHKQAQQHSAAPHSLPQDNKN